MHSSGLAEWENRLFSNEWSLILNVMILRNYFTPLKLKIGKRDLDRKSFALRNFGVL